MGEAATNLHLGAGTNVIAGWLNYDLEPKEGAMALDLREPLPHAGGSVEMIFSEHVIEHLTKAEGEVLLRECHRVLRPQGAIRIGWPALEVLMRAYVTRSRRFRKFVTLHLHPPPRHWDELFSDCLFSWEHRYAYSSKHLASVLDSIGFHEIRRRRFGQSDHGFTYDIRDDPATAYLEAVK